MDITPIHRYNEAITNESIAATSSSTYGEEQKNVDKTYPRSAGIPARLDPGLSAPVDVREGGDSKGDTAGLGGTAARQ